MNTEKKIENFEPNFEALVKGLSMVRQEKKTIILFVNWESVDKTFRQTLEIQNTFGDYSTVQILRYSRKHCLDISTLFKVFLKGNSMIITDQTDFVRSSFGQYDTFSQLLSLFFPLIIPYGNQPAALLKASDFLEFENSSGETIHAGLIKKEVKEGFLIPYFERFVKEGFFQLPTTIEEFNELVGLHAIAKEKILNYKAIGLFFSFFIII